MKKALFYTLMFVTIQLMVTYLTLGVLTLINSPSLPPKSNPVMVGVTIASSLVTIILFYWLKWTSASPRFIQSRPWAQLSWTM